MPIVQAKCKNCGGMLQVDSSVKVAVCPHCDATYIIEDEANSPDIIDVKLNAFHAHLKLVHAYLHIDDEKSFEYLEKADDILNELEDIAPQDYRLWWGRIEFLMSLGDYWEYFDLPLKFERADFNRFKISSLDYMTENVVAMLWQIYQGEQYYKNIELFAPHLIGNDCFSAWFNYKSRLREMINLSKDAINKYIGAQIDRLESTIQSKPDLVVSRDLLIKVQNNVNNEDLFNDIVKKKLYKDRLSLYREKIIMMDILQKTSGLEH